MTETWTHKQVRAKKWEGQQWDYADEKFDGWRVTIFVQDDGSLIGFGQDRKKKGFRPDLEFFARFPRLHKAIETQRMRLAPPRTSFDCEIVTAANERFDVTTALRDPRMPIRIIPFAIPFFDGEDKQSASREWFENQCDTWGLVRSQAVRRISPSWGGIPTREKLIERAVKMQSEGWVLKSGGQCGKWYKVKAEEEVDCVVTGTIPGQGKYIGQVGALVVSVYNEGNVDLVEIASVSGMDDAERLNITKLAKDGHLIGRVCEVKYQLVGSQGRLVHPRFKRWRPDKDADDCTIDQLKKDTK